MFANAHRHIKHNKRVYDTNNMENGRNLLAILQLYLLHLTRRRLSQYLDVYNFAFQCANVE